VAPAVIEPTEAVKRSTNASILSLKRPPRGLATGSLSMVSLVWLEPARDYSSAPEGVDPSPPFAD
jgi:hypothetical protein